MRAALLLTLLAIALTACGDDEAPRAPGAGTSGGSCEVLTRLPSWGRQPMLGYIYAQEVWIAYHRKGEKGKPGYRPWPRKKHEAEALAKGLCRDVHGGKDLGDIARRHSNANGALGRGIVQLPDEADRAKPDARAILLFRAEVGELTPLIEWEGGYWFARRIAEPLARKLAKLLDQEARRRARARVIHIHHAGAWPRRYEFDEFTKEQALQKAWAIIRTIEHGADFEELARKHSNVPSRNRGGLLKTTHPVTGKETEWIRWGDRAFTQPLLDAILLEAPVGKVYGKPVISKRGIDIVKVLERRLD